MNAEQNSSNVAVITGASGIGKAAARALNGEGYQVALFARRADRPYERLAINADDIAEIIACAITRPGRLTLNEILVRSTAQPG